ncbi:protein of unknown function [Flavobacteriaceae bacterium MAR_2010_188]|nr:protein of unknown function [Flavobacteriaceae bacterium MAR_2010_188]
MLTMVLLLFTCNDKDSENKRVLSNSSGNINNLSVVVDNMMWQDAVGEAVRDIIASPVEGLSTDDEPMFAMRQMPPQVFSDFTTKNRIILILKKGENERTLIKRNVYAQPQTVVFVLGQTDAEIINQLNENGDKIIKAFKKEEVREQQRRIKLSLFDTEPIESQLGVSIKFPSAYRIAKNEDGFFWIRKDINTGTMDLMIYEVPLNSIRTGDSATIDIVKMRDSIGETHIQGRLDGSFMITEKAYAPYRFDEIVDNKPTIVTKGLWDVKNDFMSGPFINYAIEDKENNRYVIVEGYVFSPSKEKRDSMFELESIIESVKIE